jgi:hypothetical protein
MSHPKVLKRIGTPVMSALLGVMMAFGLTGALAAPASAAQLTPLDLCLMIFPNGISGSGATEAALQGSGLTPEQIQAIVGAASAGDMTCYDIFGGGPVEPTEVPVEPTEIPVEPTEIVVEPTEIVVVPTEVVVEPTKVTAEPTKVADSGKTEPTKTVAVTTMPSTGDGAGPSSGIPTAALLAVLVMAIAGAAGTILRLTTARATRR